MSKTKPKPEGLAPDIRQFVLDDQAPLVKLWDKHVAQLVDIGPYQATEGEKDRHRIYSLALMTLVKEYWNGNKKGIGGEYLDRTDQLWQEASKAAGKLIYRPNKNDDPLAPAIKIRDYMGHNIAALAVDGDGDIIDFEFNHNEIFCSSVEHAESRLVRRMFSLALLDEGWHLASFPLSSKPATNLGNVTLYTSLEPCAQCAGIMTLAGIKQVVYLQRDFGASSVANIIHSLTNTTLIPAPRPIPASDFDFDYYDELNYAFRSFSKVVVEKPFWKHPTDATRNDNVVATTSFLCTDTAYKIYERAAEKFKTYAPAEPDFPPDKTPPPADPQATSTASVPTFKVKPNKEVLASARTFVAEAVRIGRRGTPHRL